MEQSAGAGPIFCCYLNHRFRNKTEETCIETKEIKTILVISSVFQEPTVAFINVRSSPH